MDVVSHGLWGVALSRRRVRWWAAATAGALPDVIAFLPARAYELSQGTLNVMHEVRPVEAYPAMTLPLYRVSHSLAGLAVLALLTWLALWAWPRLARFLEAPSEPGSPGAAPPGSAATLTAWLLAPWAFHLAVDAPLHSADFFPTPLLWPFSDRVVAGIPWAQASVWIPNLVLLALALWLTRPGAAPLSLSPRSWLPVRGGELPPE